MKFSDLRPGDLFTIDEADKEDIVWVKMNTVAKKTLSGELLNAVSLYSGQVIYVEGETDVHIFDRKLTFYQSDFVKEKRNQ